MKKPADKSFTFIQTTTGLLIPPAPTRNLPFAKFSGDGAKPDIAELRALQPVRAGVAVRFKDDVPRKQEQRGVREVLHS